MHRFLLVFVLCLMTTPAVASVCDRAIQQAAKMYNVPLPIMQAVALVESGRTVNGRRAGWPWTINFKGQGYFFETRFEAENFARKILERGETLFDTGCFQVNYRWHGESFPSVEAMFSPELNAEYAARYLSTLYEEVGDWLTAVGYYHSRTPDYTIRYQEKIVQAINSLDDTPVEYAATEQENVATRILRPVSNTKSILISQSLNQTVNLQSLIPKTTGAVPVRIFTSAKSLVDGKLPSKSRVISYKGD